MNWRQAVYNGIKAVQLAPKKPSNFAQKKGQLEPSPLTCRR